MPYVCLCVSAYISPEARSGANFPEEIKGKIYADCFSCPSHPSILPLVPDFVRTINRSTGFSAGVLCLLLPFSRPTVFAAPSVMLEKERIAKHTHATIYESFRQMIKDEGSMLVVLLSSTLPCLVDEYDLCAALTVIDSWRRTGSINRGIVVCHRRMDAAQGTQGHMCDTPDGVRTAHNRFERVLSSLFQLCCMLLLPMLLLLVCVYVMLVDENELGRILRK